ncbi:hypothetical protein AXF42_Ash020325 [Apostasia shenzhenica]|uniref:Uncharacterized protein n=1 Tax=Apostasia shenzhenica TaxID=1088818 RepID=A0A2I0B0P8_9ASPA|nr:hypothetical protein AXF42_Ash020325 [Apostasia shenzhenica]
MEAIPIQFCRAVSSYWRRRRYQRLDTGKKTVKVARLGGGAAGQILGSGHRRTWRLRRPFRLRFRLPSPVRLLARLRDAYVDAMLGIAGKGSGLAAAPGAETLLSRRIPKGRPSKTEPGEFERRLLLEICRSISASRDLAVY